MIAYQTTEGSWVDISLINALFGNQISEIVSKIADKTAVITYLVAKWIEKNYPQKQYALVVKKGMNFIKKNTQNHEEFDALYRQYVL